MPKFPEIIAKMPEADAPLEGVKLWLLRGPTASLTFFEALADSRVPEHTHAAQWGIVVEGEMVLTIGGKSQTYRRGDEYLIPTGVPHSATFKAGLRVIDFFDDPDRYRPRR